MRRRIATAFALGFLSGVVALGLLIAIFFPRRLPAVRQEVVIAAPSMVASRPPIDARPHGSEPRLTMPIDGIDPSRLTSNFTQARNGHAHEALDIMAPRGTPVRAVAGGAVAKLFTSRYGGLTIYQFDDSETWCYYYAHLDRYEPGLKQGALVHIGDVIGYVGSTGDASPDAPHLHFAVFRLGPEKQWWKGTAVDPLPLLQATAQLLPKRP
jgi:murein DD-endopeptidase MepM/ murein hydrolase activator NlpD